MEKEEMSSDKSKRLVWLDGLKGFLMILVIWSHSLAFNSTYGFYFTTGYMAVFYWISGYLFKNKGQSFKAFLMNKSKRLLIPYLLYGIVLTLFGTVYMILRGSSLNVIICRWVGLLYGRYMLYPDNFLNNIFFLKPFDSTLWFLLSLFLTYTLFFLLIKIKKVTIAIVMLVVIGYLFTYLPILLPWSLDTIPVTTVFMVGGGISSES